MDIAMDYEYLNQISSKMFLINCTLFDYWHTDYPHTLLKHTTMQSLVKVLEIWLQENRSR